MRNFLSLEAHNASTSTVVLSLEEEAVVISEVAADEAAITTELSEVARATDVSDAMEDLAVIADNIEEATPVEGALFDTAANMAVAGTDIEPTVLVPASESFKGRKLSAESMNIKARALAIWQQIKEALRRIWVRIESFFHKYFGMMPGLKRDIEAARKRVQASAGMTAAEKKMPVTSGVRTLTVDGKVLKTETEVLDTLKVFKTVIGDVFGTSSAIKKSGEDILSAINAFDAEEPQKEVAALVTKFRSYKNTSSSFKPTSGFNSRYPGFSISATAPLFNNTSIVFKQPATKETSDIAYLSMCARSGSFNVQTTDKVIATPESIDFSVMSISGMESVLSICDDLVDVVETYQRSKALTEASAFKSKLAAVSEKAGSVIDALNSKGETPNTAAVSAYRALINMNTFYCNLIANPSTGLATNLQSTVRTMLHLITKSLAQYK